MAIYKPSHFSPQLQEIEIVAPEDRNKESFTCTINTSGESVKAYKLDILSGRGDEEIYKGEIQNLAYPIKNKGTLTIFGIDSSYGMQNGKDYQWGIRVYNARSESTDQPNTKVCDGFLVGSTKTVVWMKLDSHGEEEVNKPIADKIVYDRYIEFNTSPSEMVLGYNDEENKTLPTSTYVERQKIDWVDKELGENKNYIKIETQEAFTYNYINETPFTIYQCSDQHTVNSFFADPNTNINVANFVMIYNNASDANSALASGDNPGTSLTVDPAFGARKIVGYSSDTGEVRVHDAFESAPKNGMVYRIFEKDVTTGLFTEIFASDLKAKVPSDTQYYQNHVAKGTVCYKDVNLTEQADVTLTIDTLCTYIGTYSGRAIGKVTQGQVPYYVNLPIDSSLKTTEEIQVTNISGKSGKITVNSIDYYVDFSSIKFYYEGSYTQNPYQSQVIGGVPITDNKFITQTNDISSNKFQLFVQPNINIKTDETNPNEIVFDNGCRVDIIKQTTINPTTGKEIDITFEKLDNTQWLLTKNSLSIATGEIPTDSRGIVQPQTPYTVYTDFMDSMPYNLIYARKSPQFIMQYRDLNMPNEEYKDFDGTQISLRNIQFKTNIFNDEGHTTQYQQGLKYYQYILYVLDNDVATEIAKSNEIYAADLEEIVWGYRGFMTEVNHVGILQGTEYRIKVSIVNENDHEFSYTQDFFVKYNVEGQTTSLQIEADCNLSGIKITANAPEYVIPTLPDIRAINIIQMNSQNIYDIDKNEKDCYYFVESITYGGTNYSIGYHHYYTEDDSFGANDENLFDCDLIYYNVNNQQFKNQQLLGGKYYKYTNTVFELYSDTPQAITIEDLAPITASDNGDYVIIGEDKMLYYDSVLTEDFPETKIELPSNSYFLTQFQLTPDFINKIPLESGEDPDAEISNNKSEILSLGYQTETGEYDSGIMHFNDAGLQNFLGYLPISSDDESLLPIGYKSKAEKFTKDYTLVTGQGYFVKASDIVTNENSEKVLAGTEYFFSSTCYPATKAGTTDVECIARKFDASKNYGTIFVDKQFFIKSSDLKKITDEMHGVTLYLHNCKGKREVYVAPRGTNYYNNQSFSEIVGTLFSSQVCYYNNADSVWFESNLNSSNAYNSTKYYIKMDDIPTDPKTGKKVTMINDPQKAQLQMYDDYGNKLNCFKVGNNFTNGLNLMTLLYGIPEIDEYKFVLQNNFPEKYITLLDESGVPQPFPETGDTSKYYIYYPVDYVIENGVKKYVPVTTTDNRIPKDQNGRYPGVYKYNRDGSYSPAGLETLYIYNLKDADNLGIPGWSELSWWEKYNYIGVPTYCRTGTTKKDQGPLNLYTDVSCTIPYEDETGEQRYLPDNESYTFEFANENVGRILYTWDTLVYFRLKDEERNYIAEYNIIWNDSLILGDVSDRYGQLNIRANQSIKLYTNRNKTEGEYIYTPEIDQHKTCQYVDDNTVIVELNSTYYFCDSTFVNGGANVQFDKNEKRTNYIWVDNSYHSYAMLLEMLEREQEYSDQQWLSMYLTITNGYNQNKYECTMKNSNPRWKSIDI